MNAVVAAPSLGTPVPTSTVRAVNAYTAAAIAVREAEVALWIAVAVAGAVALLPGAHPSEIIPLDRDRRWIRSAVASYGTPAVRSAARAYDMAANACIAKNAGMVWQLAHKLEKKAIRYGLEKADIVQEGMIGLQRAMETFDPARGLAFSTYAHWWVYQCMTRAIANSGIIRVPVHARARAEEEAAGKNTPQTGKRCRKSTAEKVRCTEQVLSLDADMFSSGPDYVDSKKYGDFLVSDAPSQEDETSESEDRAQLMQAMSCLQAKERIVIRMRFVEDKTLEEVGAALDLTRERIRQIEKAALMKMRTYLDRRGVR